MKSRLVNSTPNSESTNVRVNPVTYRELIETRAELMKVSGDLCTFSDTITFLVKALRIHGGIGSDLYRDVTADKAAEPSH